MGLNLSLGAINMEIKLELEFWYYGDSSMVRNAPRKPASQLLLTPLSHVATESEWEMSQSRQEPKKPSVLTNGWFSYKS